MKHYSRFITLAGGILAFFSFALPWDDDYLGVEYVNMSFNTITVMFFASLAVIGISLILNRKEPWKAGASKVLVIISSYIGFCCFAILFYGTSLELKIGGSWFDKIQYGVFLNAIGFVLAIFGVLDFPETKDGPETKDRQENNE